MELYKIVTSLDGKMEEKSAQLKKNGVFERYKVIHKAYADLHKQDLEALKRGLFLIWYALVEPPCFTGINDLNAEAENRIIHTLERRLRQNLIDYELEWMLSYYATWDYVFERFSEYDELQRKLKQADTELPSSINKQDMTNRGQMGVYWNSLNWFD